MRRNSREQTITGKTGLCLSLCLPVCLSFPLSLSPGVIKIRDEDPKLFSMDPDPAQLKKNSGSDSGSDLKSK